MPFDQADQLLVASIRQGDADAWKVLIDRFEGRLLAFVDSRLRNHATSEDVVQDTFFGFLTSLPNYDVRTSLETFLFSIAAHKLTDVLRRQGRRPALPLTSPAASSDDDGSGSVNEPISRLRRVSSLARSREERSRQARQIEAELGQLIRQSVDRGDFSRLKCLELLFVLGWSNKSVAERIGLTEQTVANFKHAAVVRLQAAVGDE
ncbi:MAG: RNA polymerase sigma factor [Planctomycetales bacterium]|nr:RNA polymerase sigma factor [Planctomycetales bacterium]